MVCDPHVKTQKHFLKHLENRARFSNHKLTQTPIKIMSIVPLTADRALTRKA